LHGISKQGAVKRAVQAALEKAASPVDVEARLRRLWAENPLPPRTGKRADKAFFDDLSGGL
jgi:antitoxin VapB